MIRKIEKTKILLNSFLKNPGFFSVLVLGDNGVGKEFLINEVLKEDGKTCVRFYPFEIGEDEDEISKIFKNEIILIKNCEELSENQQNILFKAMSTDDSGRIGLKDNDGFKRMIFTSSFNVEQLRESKEYLSDRFWSRISQLVISVPSFKDFPDEIVANFKSVWEEMDFEEYNKCPKYPDFYLWLRDSCTSFAGNFRDLDTIAVLWHQYRLIKYSEVKQQVIRKNIESQIFDLVKADFNELSHYPTQKADISNTFEFKKGKKWRDIEQDFRSNFKFWAKKNYGSIKEATQQLNMPSRKMDKW